MVLGRYLVPLEFRMSVHLCSTGMLRAGMPPQRMESLIEMVGGKYMRLAKLCVGNGYGMTVKTQKERNHWFQFFATQCLQSKNIGEPQRTK